MWYNVLRSRTVKLENSQWLTTTDHLHSNDKIINTAWKLSNSNRENWSDWMNSASVQWRLCIESLKHPSDNTLNYLTVMLKCSVCTANVNMIMTITLVNRREQSCMVARRLTSVQTSPPCGEDKNYSRVCDHQRDSGGDGRDLKWSPLGREHNDSPMTPENYR